MKCFSISAAVLVALSASCCFAADYEITGTVKKIDNYGMDFPGISSGSRFFGEFSTGPDPAISVSFPDARPGGTTFSMTSQGWADFSVTESNNRVSVYAEDIERGEDTWGLVMSVTLIDDEGVAFTGSEIDVADLEQAKLRIHEFAESDVFPYRAAYLFGDIRSVTVTRVPEPSAFALLGVGAFGLLAYSRRKRR